MRKRIAGRKLSRSTTTRQALFRSLVRGVVLNGKIETTRAKAKVVESYMGKIITIAKGNDVSARRRVLANLAGDNQTRKGIFRLLLKMGNAMNLRLTPLPPRRGDLAKMTRIEIVGWTPEEKKVKEKAKVSKKEEKEVKKSKKI